MIRKNRTPRLSLVLAGLVVAGGGGGKGGSKGGSGGGIAGTIGAASSCVFPEGAAGSQD